MAIAAARGGKLIGIIGDEDTCVGFLLGGIGKFTVIYKKEFVQQGVHITSPIEQRSLIELYYALGEMNKNRQPNFLVVNTETPITDIEGKHFCI